MYKIKDLLRSHISVNSQT